MRRPLLLAASMLALLVGCSALPVPRRSPYHPSDADLSITRIVHASLIVELRGTRLLVDPWFHSGFVMRQREPLGLTPGDLPGAAAVLLTHEHGGHTDDVALRELAASVPEAIAPARLVSRLQALGFAHVTPLAWWESAAIGDVRVTAVPARHPVPENGYVLEAHGVSVYLGGDTGTFDEIGDVAERFPSLDMALVPVGGERLLGLRRTMGPEHAARAAAALGARRVMPIAYGKGGGFPVRWFSSDPVARFIEACAEQGITRDRVVVLEPGESWHYYKPQATMSPGGPAPEGNERR